MIEEVKSWEAAYRRRSSGEITPHQDVEYLNELFQKNKVNKILDLGCGDGRHLVYFARCGYCMTGFDYAPTALKRAREWLRNENLGANLFCADMKAIPCADTVFDAVLCIAVINHNRMPEIRMTIREILRLSRPGGWLFLVVATERSIPKAGNSRYVMLEHHTYIPTSGHEKGVPHYFFSEEELRNEFRCFNVRSIRRDKRNRSCVLMQRLIQSGDCF